MSYWHYIELHRLFETTITQQYNHCGDHPTHSFSLLDQIPDIHRPDRPILHSQRQLLAILAEPQIIHSRIQLESFDDLAGFGLADQHQVIVAAAGENRALGREFDRVDGVGVLLQGEQAVASRHIGHLDRMLGFFVGSIGAARVGSVSCEDFRGSL